MFKNSVRSKRHVTIKRSSNDLLEPVGEDMNQFCTEAQKSLWHAFKMLQVPGSSTVHTSQLKVITANIGMAVSVEKAEELLSDSEHISKDLTFEQYYNIVKKKLFAKMETDSDAVDSIRGASLAEVHRVCWNCCSYKREHGAKHLSDNNAELLWRIFNFLVETDQNGNPILPLTIHPDEAQLIFRWFIGATGQMNKENIVKQLLQDRTETIPFENMLNMFETDFIQTLTETELSHGLKNIFDGLVVDILKKGMMWKRGHNVKNWKERWLVLTTKELRYYTGSNEKDLKGKIVFDKDCSVEVLPEKHGNKPNRFVVKTLLKPYEMSAADLKTKNEWVSAFQKAIDAVGKDVHLQREAARARQEVRRKKKQEAEEEEKRRREEAEELRRRSEELEEERRRRHEDEDQLKKRLQELEDERRRREEAEARVLEEQLLREREQQRLRELEEIKRQLEKLLNDERQAKKDEEIVRALQSRILEEEFQKREELEKLKQQQEELLQAEREQREGLESQKQDQERLLREAQEKLDQLERERAAASEKLQEASEKLKQAENTRHIMEEKVKLWKTPVGLARPIQPTVDPLVTHRGLGAFCDADFDKKGEEQGGNSPPFMRRHGPDDGTKEAKHDSDFLKKMHERQLRSEPALYLEKEEKIDNPVSGEQETTSPYLHEECAQEVTSPTGTTDGNAEEQMQNDSSESNSVDNNEATSKNNGMGPECSQELTTADENAGEQTQTDPNESNAVNNNEATSETNGTEPTCSQEFTSPTETTDGGNGEEQTQDDLNESNLVDNSKATSEDDRTDPNLEQEDSTMDKLPVTLESEELRKNRTDENGQIVIAEKVDDPGEE